nr:hypothetical protein Iba_chr04aCG18620 [Ipomoea batatas]
MVDLEDQGKRKRLVQFWVEVGEFGKAAPAAARRWPLMSLCTGERMMLSGLVRPGLMRLSQSLYVQWIKVIRYKYVYIVK